MGGCHPGQARTVAEAGTDVGAGGGLGEAHRHVLAPPRRGPPAHCRTRRQARPPRERLGAARRILPGQTGQRRSHDRGEGHQDTHRVARQADDRHPPAAVGEHPAVPLGLARLHGHLDEVHVHRGLLAPLRLRLRQHRQRIEGPRGHAPGGDDEIGAGSGLPQHLSQGIGRVTAAGHARARGPLLGDQPSQQQGVGVGDRPGLQRLAGVTQLCPGGDHRHAHLRPHQHRAEPHGGQGGDGRRGQPRPRRHDRIARGHVLPGTAHVETGAGCRADLDTHRNRVRAGSLVGVLHLDHGVRSLRQHRPGHDPLSGSRHKRARCGASRDVPAHRQNHRRFRAGTGRVPRAHRVTVHRRVRPRRHRDDGSHVLGQHPAVRPPQLQALALQG